MRFSIRHIDPADKFCQALTLDAVHSVVPQAVIEDVLAAHGVRAQRERKLSLPVVVLILIAMNLYTHVSIGHVLRKVSQGLRLIWSDPDYAVPSAAALDYRRQQLGVQPLVALFHQVCRPLATPETKGAFLFGYRLMAIDGSIEDVPDSPANAAAFGRAKSQRGASAYPQVQCVYLAECGTHAIVDAGFWPYHVSERVGGRRLLRSVTPDMLVLWDRGFQEYDQVAAVRQRDAQVLGRLPAHVKPAVLRALPDGSVLAYLRPSEPARRKRGERILVRIVTYTITDPALPGHGERHRLVTTLLDCKQAPALDLICAYHERWEVELVIDEIDTHQRLAARTLRSLTPLGVLQELYALLLAHYTVRALMHQAALEADCDPDRLSFVHAVRVLQDAIPEFQMLSPADYPALYERLLQDIAVERLPERQLRINPRVVKRKMSKFRLKRRHHAHPPRPQQRTFRHSLAVI